MKPSSTLVAIAAASLFLVAGFPALAAQEDVPASQTTEAFVEALKPRPAEPQKSARVVRTRGVNVTAASQTAAIATPVASRAELEVLFAFNSDRIAGASVRSAENLSRALQDPQLKDGRFRVVGHTDAVGTREANQQLSQQRANAVRKFLIDHGVSADRLRAEGRGFEELKNSTDPEAGENRRVEIVAEY